MAMGTPFVLFIISLVLVILVCCLSRCLIVPMAQSSNNEMNTRKYLDKEEKRAFFNKMIENWFIQSEMEKNKEKLKIKEMQVGESERA